MKPAIREGLGSDASGVVRERHVDAKSRQVGRAAMRSHVFGDYDFGHGGDLGRGTGVVRLVLPPFYMRLDVRSRQ